MPLDLTTIGLGAFGTVLTGATSYLIHRVIENDKTLMAHIAVDEVEVVHTAAQLQDLKAGQRDQTEKLDRLIEHLLK